MPAEEKKNYFQELYSIDVSGHVEQKNGLSYLSWAWAWAELKKLHPDAVYTVYEDEYGRFYHTDGKTCWVKTGVTVNGIEHIEYLPVMDLRNKSIPADNVTSFDVNKTIQRSLTKAIARHGLGLFIFAGEDLPEAPPTVCADCGRVITASGKLSADQIVAGTTKSYGVALCADCGSKRKAARSETKNKKEETPEESKKRRCNFSRSRGG